jgi:hypothetical protein
VVIRTPRISWLDRRTAAHRQSVIAALVEYLAALIRFDGQEPNVKFRVELWWSRYVSEHQPREFLPPNVWGGLMPSQANTSLHVIASGFSGAVQAAQNGIASDAYFLADLVCGIPLPP